MTHPTDEQQSVKHAAAIRVLEAAVSDRKYLAYHAEADELRRSIDVLRRDAQNTENNDGS